MGSIRFERQPEVRGSNKNVIEFDSSPDLAISRAYGLEEGSIELRETSRTSEQVNYDVFAREIRAKPGDPPKPLQRRGILKHIPSEEMMRRQTSGVFYGRHFH